MRKITFLVDEWRDTAYSTFSGEGCGAYNSTKRFTRELNDREWKILKDEGRYRLNGKHMLYLDDFEIVDENTTTYWAILTFNSYDC